MTVIYTVIPMDILEHLADLGYDLVPLLGKRAICPWKKQIPLDRIIEIVRSRGADVGLVTGRSGIIVADADDSVAVDWIQNELPKTPQMAKTARGIHAYFRAPAEAVPIVHGFRGMALDILSGNSYASLRTWLSPGLPIRPSELPEFPSGLIIRQKKEIVMPPIVDPERDRLLRRAAAYIQRIEREEGRRDLALFKAACVLVQRFGLLADEAYPILSAFNLTISPPFPDARVRYKIDQAMKLKGGK